MHMNIENMETASTKGIEDRFTAAVNVIRGLPKNGKSFFFHLYCFVVILSTLFLVAVGCIVPILFPFY